MLFSASIIFILYFIKLPKQESFPESIMDNIQSKLEDYISINLTKITLIVDAVNEGAFSVDSSSFSQFLKDNYNGFAFYGNNPNPLNSDPLPANYNSASNLICLQQNIGKKNVFYIYLSEQFARTTEFPCTQLTLDEYKIGAIEKQSVFSLNKLKDLSSQYNDDYAILKNNLGVPENFDFSIIISDKSKFQGVNFILQNPSKEAQTYARTISYPILTIEKSDKKDFFTMGDITIKIWQ
jgi:hypothetical protein